MVTLAPVTSPALQQVHADLLGLLRNGSVVEARVIAMLEGNVARLAIAGQTIDVTTPLAFKAGTKIPVTVDGSGRDLKLVVQPAVQGAGQQAGKGAPEPPSIGTIGNRLIVVQAAITEALLNSGSIFPGSQSPIHIPDASSAQSNQNQWANRAPSNRAAGSRSTADEY